MNKRSTKNFKVLALILVTSALLLVAIIPNISSVKAATQDSVYVYTVIGGAISANGTALTGGSTYKYDNGAAISLTATPATGYKFLNWIYLSAAGANTSTSNPFVFTVAEASCALEAMFTPSVNDTTSTSSQSGASNVILMISVGGTTEPTEGSYTNYTVGTVSNFNAVAASGFKFLYWNVATSTGSIYTTNPLPLNVTENVCAIQAMFIPTSSTVTLPAITTVDEYSSATAIIVALILVAVAFGTFTLKKKAKN